MKKFFIFFIFYFLSIINLYSIVRTWNSFNFEDKASNPLAWRPNGVPKNNDMVLFDGTFNANCNWDIEVALSSFVVNGYTGNISVSSDTTVQKNFVLNTGSFFLQNSTWNIKGDFSASSLFDAGTGKIVLSGKTFQTFDLTGGSLYNFEINSSSSVFIENIGGIDNNFTILNGTVTANNGLTIYIRNGFYQYGGNIENFNLYFSAAFPSEMYLSLMPYSIVSTVTVNTAYLNQTSTITKIENFYLDTNSSFNLNSKQLFVNNFNISEGTFTVINSTVSSISGYLNFVSSGTVDITSSTIKNVSKDGIVISTGILKLKSVSLKNFENNSKGINFLVSDNKNYSFENIYFDASISTNISVPNKTSGKINFINSKGERAGPFY